MSPAAVALWRRRLQHPRLSAAFLWTMIVLPPIAALAIPRVTPLGYDWPLALVWPAGVAAMAALGVLYLYTVARPARKWRETDPWTRPLWLRFGWAPLAAAVPLVAGAAPSVMTLGGIGVCAILGSIWARVTSSHLEASKPPSDWGRYVGWAPAPLLIIFISTQKSFDTGFDEFTMVTLVIGTLAGAGILETGEAAVADELSVVSARVRKWIFGGLLVFALALPVLTYVATVTVSLSPALGLISALALVDRALAWGRFDRLIDFRRVALLVGWAAVFLLLPIVPAPTMELKSLIALQFWLIVPALLTAASGLTDAFNLKLPHFLEGSGAKT